MAEGKNKILVYRDWIHLFEDLSDEELGKLMRHFFEYVNDLEPVLEDRLLKGYWKNMEITLKRDLKKWEQKADTNRVNGQKGGRPKNPKKPTGFSNNPTNPQKGVSVSVSVNDSVSVINKNSLISEIKISDVEEKNKKYFKIATEFYKMLRTRIIEIDGNVKRFDKKKAKVWLDAFRLMTESDGIDQKQFARVYKFLQTDTFWIPNIQSPEKLRQQMSQLAAKSGSAKLSEHNKSKAQETDADRFYKTITKVS